MKKQNVNMNEALFSKENSEEHNLLPEDLYQEKVRVT